MRERLCVVDSGRVGACDDLQMGPEASPRDAPPHALACAEAPAFAQQILNRLGEKSTGGRAYVNAHHHWGTTLRQLNALLEVA